MIDAVNVIIRKSRAYVPSFARTSDGFDIITNPVYSVDPNVQDLARVLERVIATGMPRVPTPTLAEMKRRVDPLLKAAGVKTWSELARGGQEYAILWESGQIRLIPSKLDQKGRFVADYAQERIFPKDTPLSIILAALLDDARSRPELGLQNNSAS